MRQNLTTRQPFVLIASIESFQARELLKKREMNFTHLVVGRHVRNELQVKVRLDPDQSSYERVDAQDNHDT